MIFIISGSSHTGKTFLAQQLLERYQYPYLSVDHLKMGLIRSGQTVLTPEDDEELTDYLWPIVCEMIKTAIENKQNLIVEGCYIPYDYRKDFSGEYLAHIKHVCLVFSQDYIKYHYETIMQYGNVIERRLDDDYPKTLMLEDNKKVLDACIKHGCEYIIIDKSYNFYLDMDIVLSSERLCFKRITQSDFEEISVILKDPEVMYAWEHSFTDEDVEAWIEKRRAMYDLFGYDYFLAIDRVSNEVVGQIGLLDEAVDGQHFTGIGYILKKEFRHKGFAAEGAKTMIDYAFNVLGKEKVIATIRPENTASCEVAKRLDMHVESEFVKMHKGREMVHLVYSLSKEK